MRIAFLMIGSFFFCRPSTRAISSGVGGAAEFLGQPGGGPPPLAKQFDHVGRNADRLGGVDQSPLDRLLDPVAGVGAEPCADGRVEPFDRPQQAEVAFLDQVLQAEPLAGVAAGDVDHQPQVGADHPVAGRGHRPSAMARASSCSSSAVSRAVSLISRRYVSSGVCSARTFFGAARSVPAWFVPALRFNEAMAFSQWCSAIDKSNYRRPRANFCKLWQTR